MEYFYSKIKSPIGILKIVAFERKLAAIILDSEDPNRIKINPKKESKKEEIIVNTREQLEKYFDGALSQFKLPLHIETTEFQKKVWSALEKTPFGKTLSYSELAKKIHHENAARAVGMACSKNPIAIVIPCHRIIGANQTLTGYAGGLKIKKYLLEHEKKFGGAF